MTEMTEMNWIPVKTKNPIPREKEIVFFLFEDDSGLVPAVGECRSRKNWVDNGVKYWCRISIPGE